MEKASVLCLIFALSISFAFAGAENDLYSDSDLTLENGLSWTFYKSSCPKMESIVQIRIKFYLEKDITLAAGLLRLHFHDSFVQGCDASVLLDGSPGRAATRAKLPSSTSNASGLIDALAAKGLDVTDLVALSVSSIFTHFV
ncbi:hypothetical protein SUGI_0480110 [Cryptomeria japonica]|nr:hypothetical protein SUGI_0480110 [Cryptomeria japonica]